MRTHYLSHLQDQSEERAVCGVWLGEGSKFSEHWSLVDCKRCLHGRSRITRMVAAEEKEIIHQMGHMADFMRGVSP